jgi:signal peptidase I
MCFYRQEMNRAASGRWEYRPEHISHTGDRILVNKFAYDEPFGDPRRWDVIVFKFPGNAKQNYIKRLIGLPHETIRLYHGDVYVTKENETEQIARKPADKLRHIMQVVNDSRFIPPELTDAGWPANWQVMTQGGGWRTTDAGKSFSCSSTATDEWIHYRHYPVDFEQWDKILRGETYHPATPILITDFYPYNACSRRSRMYDDHMYGEDHRTSPFGIHWVGDLAVECQVEVLGEGGHLLFDLIEAGRHHQCSIDVATGEARVEINGGQLKFDQLDREAAATRLTGSTRLQGPGKYSVRFANVDNQLMLWVNNRSCDFGHPATYTVDADYEYPTSEDLSPVRVGANGLSVHVRRLQILRDVYYVAVDHPDQRESEYGQYTTELWKHAIVDPGSRSHQELFASRRDATFTLGADQFFPLGDNSPMSKDGRLWNEGPVPNIQQYVERNMLIGKAVFVYWPHPYHMKIPFMDKTLPVFPNFKDMKLIR